jgi:hypothetical protein
MVLVMSWRLTCREMTAPSPAGGHDRGGLHDHVNLVSQGQHLIDVIMLVGA